MILSIFSLHLLVVFKNSLKQSGGSFDKKTVFSNWELGWSIGSVVLFGKHNFSIWFVIFSRQFLRFQFWSYIINFQWLIEGTNFSLRKIFCFNTFNQCMKWNRRFLNSRCVFSLPFMSKLVLVVVEWTF